VKVKQNVNWILYRTEGSSLDKAFYTSKVT